MRQDPLAFPSVWNQSAGFANPLFGLYREAGLAAVAVEVTPPGDSPDELAAPEFQQKIAVSLAAAIATLRGRLEEAP